MDRIGAEARKAVRSATEGRRCVEELSGTGRDGRAFSLLELDARMVLEDEA